eukprot:scaffold175497_cov17-Tisochrysis_lutea.AAC.1
MDAAGDSVPGFAEAVAAGQAAEETSDCAPRSWSPTPPSHPFADDPSTTAAASGSECSRSLAAATGGAELETKAATQAAELKA